MRRHGFLSMAMLSYLWKVFSTLAVLFAFVYLIRGHTTQEVNVEKVEEHITFYRLLYSPDGLSYYDGGIEHVYPGIIDFSKMTESSRLRSLLERSISYGEKDEGHQAFHIVLQEADGGKLREHYYPDKDMFERYQAHCSGAEGPGASTCTQHAVYVRIHNSNIIQAYRDVRSNPRETSVRSPVLEQSLSPQKLVPGKLIVTIAMQNTG